MDELEDLPAVGSRRDQAVERSLRTARARALERQGRFLEVALDLLQESGSTDFTVQQLVERSGMSLRSFYQHFASKDELLLAVLELSLGDAVELWRSQAEQVDGPLGKVRVVVEALLRAPGSPRERRAVRALAAFHLRLSEQRPAEFAGVMAPLRRLFVDLVEEGVRRGVFRSDIAPEPLALVLLQTVGMATTVQVLRGGLLAGTLTHDQLWSFLTAALLAPSPDRTSVANHPSEKYVLLED